MAKKVTDAVMEEQKYEKLADHAHHLLSTKTNPGIYNRDVVLRGKERRRQRSHQGPLSKEENAIDPEHFIRNSKPLKVSQHYPSLMIKAYILANKQKNRSKLPSMKQHEEFHSEEEEMKLAQGPFQVWQQRGETDTKQPRYLVGRIKERPLRPTLRVATDYLSYDKWLKSEKDKESIMRGTVLAVASTADIVSVSDDYFNTTSKVRPAYVPCIRTVEPFQQLSYGRKYVPCYPL